MSEASFELSLFMPVFNGGDLMEGALLSIEKSTFDFQNIFISFNGADDADYRKFESLLKIGRLKKNYVFFRTFKDLPTLEHGLFCLERVGETLSPDSSLLLLAHDDRILDINFSHSFILELDTRPFSKSIYFPEYHYCNAPDYDKVTNVARSNGALNCQEFFIKTLTTNIATNMSGMIIPFHAWHDSVTSQINAKAGARFEQMACISRGVTQIIFSDQVKVCIGVRKNSDGNTLTLREHRFASLHYMILFLRNGKFKSLKLAPFYLYHLVRKTLACALVRLTNLYQG